MENENQVPLSKLLFGANPKPTAAPETPLAEAISDVFRDGLAKSLRGQAPKTDRATKEDQAANDLGNDQLADQDRG